MGSTGMKRRPGITLLILFYGLVAVRNGSGAMRPDGDLVMAALYVLVAGFLIVGFVRRIKVSRIVAIVFHAVHEGVVAMSLLMMLRPGYIREAVPNLSDDLVPVVMGVLVIVFLGVTAINAGAIVYLHKNKDYFMPPAQP